MLPRRLQVKHLSIDEFIAIIATIVGQKLFKAELLLLNWWIRR